LAFWRLTDQQTDKQTDSTDPLSRSCCCEWRTKQAVCWL